MKDFGYIINKDSQIDYDKLERKIAGYVSKHEPTFNVCAECGSCTATCSAGHFTDFNPRNLTLMVRRGSDIAKIKKEIDKCMLCGKCTLACPRNVNKRNVYLRIKEALVKIERNEI